MNAITNVATNAAKAKAVPGERVLSIDALRGFDMFWIIGGSGVVLGLLKLFFHPLPAGITAQFHHAAWGPKVVCWDLIMPLFLFIVGAAMPFSFAKRQAQAAGYGRMYARILRRILVLWVLGMIVMGRLLTFDLAAIRVAGNVLQYIACGYLIGALALLHLPILGQLVLAVGLLLGYCLVMLYVPIPGHEAGVLTANVNLARYIDSQLIGRWNGFPLAPTILPSMGLGASVLLGIMAGHILRLQTGPWRKAGYLVLAGIAALIFGWLWGYWFLTVKWLWTSSFALWMAGWSYLLLAAFYVVIDICGFRRWAYPMIVIGANAILAYTVASIYGGALSDPLVRGAAAHAGEAKDLVLSLGQVGILWLILWYLYRNRTFLRV